MDTKLYLTIAAIVALLYALGFLVIPERISILFSGVAEPHAILNLRFLGGANLEHVPPELNRQDSHGVLDRRFYRH